METSSPKLSCVWHSLFHVLLDQLRCRLMPPLNGISPLHAKVVHMLEQLLPSHHAIVGRRVRFRVESRARETVAIHILPCWNRACSDVLAHLHAHRRLINRERQGGQLLSECLALLLVMRLTALLRRGVGTGVLLMAEKRAAGGEKGEEEHR